MVTVRSAAVQFKKHNQLHQMQGEKKIASPSCDFYFAYLPYFDKHSKHTFEYWTITHVHLSKYGNLEIYAYVFKLILDIVLTKCNS